MKNKRKAHESLNPYYTGSTLWVQSESLQDEEETVLILIILEVLYEAAIDIYKLEAFFVLILIILEVLYERIL